MRPVALGAIALSSLLVAAFLPSAASASSPSGAAAAADCIQVQHSKKVVKRVKVKRKGKLVKVKRRKTVRWTTCEPVPPPPGCAEPSSSLGVTARDDMAQPRFTLSRSCVTAGTVSVQLQNQGEDPHDLRLRPAGAASTAPVHLVPDEDPYELPAWSGMGAPPTDSASVALTAGDWYLWCDLLLHEQQGMNATLAVR